MNTPSFTERVTCILLITAGLAVASELAVPLFGIDAPSGWRYIDGAVRYQITTSSLQAVNVSANCSVMSNGGTVIYAWSHNLTFSESYPLTGSYNTTVTCSNNVNQVTVFHIIDIVSGDTPIKGLHATVQGYVLIDAPAEIKVSAEEGTDILYRVTPGDDESRWILTSGMDTSKSVTHTFSKSGKITVVVTATNEVSFAQTRPKTDVIRPVKGFQLTASHEIASFTETITYHLAFPGDDHFPMGPLRIELFDNEISISQKTSITSQPKISVAVLSRNFSLGVHMVVARVSSPLAAEDSSLKLTVIEPITEFNASDLVFHTFSTFPLNSSVEVSNITIRMEIVGVDTSQPPPLGIQVTWDFGEGTVETEFITGWTNEHSYTERGNHTITTLTKLTGARDTHSTSFNVRIGVLRVKLTPNIGIAREDVFSYFISGAKGHMVQFKIDFGNGEFTMFNKTNITESDVIEVKKVYPDSGMFQSTVVAWDEDFVEEITLNDSVWVYVPLTPFTVKWNDGIVYRLPVTITFSLNFVGQLPTNATCDLDFGDGGIGSVEIKPHVTTTPVTETYSTELETTSLDMATNYTAFTTTEVPTTYLETSTATESITNFTIDPNMTNFTIDPNMTALTSEEAMGTDQTEPPATVSVQVITTIVVKHNYTQLGTFSFDITCSNDVSNFTKQWSVILKSGATHFGFRTAHFLSVVYLYVLMYV